MSQRDRFTQALARRRGVRSSLGLFAGVLALALSGCSGRTATAPASPDTRSPSASAPTAGANEAPTGQSRLVLGSPEPGLSFSVPPTVKAAPASATIASPSSRRANTIPSVAASSPNAAAAAFGDAIVTGRIADAFTLLPDIEQERIGSATRFADILSRDPAWLSAAVDARASEDREVPALRVGQVPTIDEIRGVVGSSAVVKLPARKDESGWKVSWERRTVTQRYAASEERVSDDVVAWATARQKACSSAGATAAKTPADEYAGGLLGAVWLADALCTTSGAVSIASVGDIYTLDDPQAVLDAYGSGTYQWARIVTLAAPHEMHVIAAPLGDRWVVVGLAPVPATP